MYGRQFMCLTRGRPVRKYSSLQFWRGRIKIVPEIFFSSILERTNQNRKCRRMNICFEAGMFMRFFDLIWR